MAITTEQLSTAAEVVGAAPTLRDAASIWRARFPEVRVLTVDAIDMRDETHTLQLGARRVYLGASNGHCWRITTQPEEASALILTQA